MAGFRKKQRIQLIAGGMVLLAVATGLIIYASQDAFSYFKSPTDLMAETPDAETRIRIGGMVQDGSLENVAVNEVRFVATDFNAEVSVLYIGREEPPTLFGEGKGFVAEGYFRDGTFVADYILAKHDENYMPKEVIDALKSGAEGS